MAVRDIYKTVLTLITKNGSGLICGNNLVTKNGLICDNNNNNNNNNNTRLMTSFIYSNNTSSLYRSTKNFVGINRMSNYHNINRRTLPTTQKPKLSSAVNMGSILEHQKYKEMKSVLSRKDSTLGPLDTASLYILSSKGLNVNLEVLSLDALSLSTHHDSMKKGYAELQEMKQRGSVKLGKLNREDEAAILEQFYTLLAQTGLDKEALMEELFAPVNRGSGENVDKDFMLKRQLVGFWLILGTKDSERRLPMQVYTKLAVLLYSGSFTEEEDAAILA